MIPSYLRFCLEMLYLCEPCWPTCNLTRQNARMPTPQRHCHEQLRTIPKLKKDALAIVFGVKKLHDCIFLPQFMLLTDYKPLATILGTKKGMQTLVVQDYNVGQCVSHLSVYPGLQEVRVKPKCWFIVSPTGRDTRRTRGKWLCQKFLLGSELDQCPVDTNTLQEAGLKKDLFSQALKFAIVGWPDKTTLKLETHSKRNVEHMVDN